MLFVERVSNFLRLRYVFDHRNLFGNHIGNPNTTRHRLSGGRGVLNSLTVTRRTVVWHARMNVNNLSRSTAAHPQAAATTSAAATSSSMSTTATQTQRCSAPTTTEQAATSMAAAAGAVASPTRASAHTASITGNRITHWRRIHGWRRVGRLGVCWYGIINYGRLGS